MNAVDIPSSRSRGLRGACRGLLERTGAWWGHCCRRGGGSETVPEDWWLQEEWQRKVQAALSRLPEKYGQVLGLFYLEGCRCGDIARTLNLSLPQVEARLLRGRSLLKASLQR